VKRAVKKSSGSCKKVELKLGPPVEFAGRPKETGHRVFSSAYRASLKNLVSINCVGQITGTVESRSHSDGVSIVKSLACRKSSEINKDFVALLI